MTLVKLAYCYEQWDVFDSMLDTTIAAIKVLRSVVSQSAELCHNHCSLVLQEVNDARFGPDEMALQILKAYDKVTPRSRHRRLFANSEEENESLDGVIPLAAPNSKYHQSVANL